MATSPDHPGLPFVQASGYTAGRPDGPPIWIVVHDMEAHETPTTAENTANYFATGAGGRSVSSHYCVDNNSVVQCVRLADTAWTVGNRPGNNRGINWELAGFASQSRAQWLDAFGVAMFAQMAPIVRADAQRFGIPLRKLSVAELRAFTPGVTSHNDLRLAFGVTDHTDPGPNFPWDYFIAAMNGDEDMTPEENQILRATDNRVRNALLEGKTVMDDTPGYGPNQKVWIVGAIEALTAAVARLEARPADGTPSQEQVNAAVKAALLDPEVQAVLVEAGFQGAQQAERE